jgi:hypothetical protein
MADEIIGLGGRIEALKPQLRRLYDAWTRWRGLRRMPARRDIAPEELRDLLPFVAIFAAAADAADCRYELAGTMIEQVQDRPLKGLTIRDTIGPNAPYAVTGIASIYAQVIASGQPSVSRGSMSYQNRGYIEFDRLLLPLSTDDATVDHILAGIFYDKNMLRGR